MMSLIDQRMVVHHHQMAGMNKKVINRKMTLREFETKYEDGFETIIEQVQAFVNNGQNEFKNKEMRQKIQIESLISKRKQIKKLKDELQILGDQERDRMSRAPIQKADKQQDVMNNND